MFIAYQPGLGSFATSTRTYQLSDDLPTTIFGASVSLSGSKAGLTARPSSCARSAESELQWKMGGSLEVSLIPELNPHTHTQVHRPKNGRCNKISCNNQPTQPTQPRRHNQSTNNSSDKQSNSKRTGEGEGTGVNTPGGSVGKGVIGAGVPGLVAGSVGANVLSVPASTRAAVAMAASRER